MSGTPALDRLVWFLDRAGEQDNDAQALSPGRQQLAADIEASGFNPLVVFALARERQLDAWQRDLLDLYRVCVTDDGALRTPPFTPEESRP